MGYLKAGREGDYELAAKYLDLRRLPKNLESADKTELARHLKIVLDRTLWVDLSLLSEDPKGHADDGLPAHRDLSAALRLMIAKSISCCNEYDVMTESISG